MTIIYTKVNCVWMRNLDGNEWNVSAAGACRDYSRNLGEGLKHYDQIDLFGQKFFCIRQSSLQAMLAIAIDDHEIYLRPLGAFQKTPSDRPVKRGFAGLC